LLSSWSPPANLKSNGLTRSDAEGTLAGGLGAYQYAEFAAWWVSSAAATIRCRARSPGRYAAWARRPPRPASPCSWTEFSPNAPSMFNTAGLIHEALVPALS